ncbi:PadR family transcriptional regulator [Halosimplex aquaticum]|uniref:PadR family transcriptional regulator n=1 Tax=Halosimplex aquaticum TaxID=3026162 RepID=A0ABD5Y6Q1_9EURY|nr:PadR family transcriptional regulator [Halosimplex aquaticum]
MSNDNFPGTDAPLSDIFGPDSCDALDHDRLQPFILLTGFQRDLLFVVADLAETDPSGSDIKSVLDAEYLREASHGTLYRSLRHLHDEGYLRKHPIDGRTYSYHLTDEARTDMRTYLRWAICCLSGERACPRSQSTNGGFQ